MKKSDLEHRIIEMEETLELCSLAFRMIPINAIEKGIIWMPSDEQVENMRKAKDSVRDYYKRHGGG